MAAKAPTIPSHAGARGVDYRSAIVLRKERIAALVPGTAGIVYKRATSTGVSEWFNSAGFSSSTAPTSGYQDEMAVSAVEGHLAAVSFAGLDLGVSDLFSVHRVNLELPHMARWQLTPPILSPGEIGVRCVLTWDEEELYEGLFRLDPVGSQVPSPAPHTLAPASQVHEMSTPYGAHGSAGEPLTEALRDVVGHPLTVGSLEAACSRIRVLLSTWVGQEAFSPQWFAGPLRIVVSYRDPPDPTQSAAQFRLGSALPVGSNLLYDSGKLAGETGDLHAVPPGKASADATVYADCQVWDEFDAASGFGEPSQFATLTSTEAALVHDPRPAALAVELDMAIVVPAPRWRRNSEVAGGSMPNVWQCRLSRAEQPVAGFSILGVEEDPIVGVNWLSTDPPPPTVFKPYTEMSRDYDGLGVLNTDPQGKAAFIWDEDGTLASSAGEPTLYMRPSDGRWMAGWRGAAAVLRVRWRVSTRSIMWGGHAWDGRMMSWPTITRKVDDLLRSVTSAPAGDIVLSDHDGVMRRMIAHGQFPDEGWVTDGRPVTVRLMQDGSAYDDAPVVTRGVIRWPDGEGEILSAGAATFRVLPLSLSPHRAEIGRETYAKAVYPAIRTADENRPMPEVYGFHSGGLFPAAVVDVGPGKGGGSRFTLRGAVQSGKLLDFRLGETTVPAGYYTYVGNHIYSASATPGDAIEKYFFDNADGEWRVRQAGSSIGSGLYETCGQVARFKLAKLGIPFADMESSTFDAFDASCAMTVTGPTQILTILHRLQRSGRFRIVHWSDDRWRAVAESPAHLDAGIVIRDYHVIGSPRWRLRREMMGATLDVTYPAAASDPVEKRRSWPARSYRAAQQYGLQTAVPLELDTTDARVFEAYAEKLSRPAKEISVSCGREALYAYEGTTVALSLDRSLAPGGVETWALFSVEEYKLVGPSRVELDLRFSRTTKDAERV